jgi:hypothetical protein
MPWSIFTDGGGKEVAVGWAQQLLKQINAPVTPETTQFVYDWEVSEGGGGKFNPLNQGPVPGQPQLTTTGQQYGGGAADFASWQAGLQGAVAYLNMPNFTAVRDALRKGDAVGARSALIASPWAASHYNGGASFSNEALPGGKPVLPPAGTGPAAPGTTASGGDPTCAGSWPNVGPIGGGCMIRKATLRHVAGGLLMGAGGIIALPGVLVLVAFGLKSTGGLGKAANVAGAVPLPQAQVAAAGLRTAQGRAERTPASPIAYGRRGRLPPGREPGEPFRYATPRPES